MEHEKTPLEDFIWWAVIGLLAGLLLGWTFAERFYDPLTRRDTNSCDPDWIGDCVSNQRAILDFPNVAKSSQASLVEE